MVDRINGVVDETPVPCSSESVEVDASCDDISTIRVKTPRDHVKLHSPQPRPCACCWSARSPERLQMTRIAKQTEGLQHGRPWTAERLLGSALQLLPPIAKLQEPVQSKHFP